MKYYLIAGEASGDLHGSNLMKALRERDPEASFRFCGGDLMAGVGGTSVRHYRDMAYMGFVQVALHARTILRGMSDVKRDILSWQPDVLILIDYPGFNLQVAKYVKAHTQIPIYYYISPKIWAWKTWRIKAIRRDVDEMFSILPFEIPFYARHDYPIHYVGNPSVDSVSRFLADDDSRAVVPTGLDGRPVVALLAGSRRAEIKDNLPLMLQAAARYPQYQFVVAGAPGIEPSFYDDYLAGTSASVVFGSTYALLSHAHAALVTSGTATLETALFRVPQVVCYYIRCGRFVSFLRRMVLKVPYISLVNLIADAEVVPELVADGMTVPNLCAQLDALLPDTPARAAQLAAYDRLAATLGPAGASDHAAEQMRRLLSHS